jgi:uncharacterized repeat protein (TIGR01451 family)
MNPTKSLSLAAAVLLAWLTSLPAQTNTWTLLSVSGGPPQPRYGHTATLNTANGRMMVFGGSFSWAGMPVGNDVWILNDVRTNGGNAWQALTVSGASPAARGFQSAVYDQTNNRMIIFGGDPHVGSCYLDVNDVWVLTNADGSAGTAGWSQLSPSGTPPAIRSFAGAVYDPTSNRLIIHGGYEACVSPYYSDVWVLSNANGLGGTPAWTQLSPAGGGPGPRTGPATAYATAHHRMIIFGGASAGGYANDTWVLSNANGLGGTPTWTLLNPTGPLPAARGNFAAGYDPDLNLLVVFGGGGTGVTNDTWVLSNANGLGTPAWTQLNPGGPLPSARNQFAGILVPGANRMIICGGVQGYSIYNDVWALQYATPGLVGAWHFSEGSGATTADSAGSHPGTLANSPTWVTGLSGTALNFNGNNYVVVNSLGPILGAATNFTVEAWVKPDSTSTYGRWEVYCEGSSMDFNIELNLWSNFNTYNPCFMIGGFSGQYITAPSALSVGSWHHLAGVFQSGAGGILYVDGQSVAANPSMTAPAATATETDLGRAPNDARYFGGIIDEVQVFNTARGPAQILADYQKLAPVLSADLVVGQTVSPNPVAIGANVTLHLSVTNLGPDTAADVVLNNYLMPELNFISATLSQGNYNFNGSTLTCNLGSLAAHATATVTIVATVTMSSPGLGNTCAASSSTLDPDPTNNTSTISLATVAPRPSITGISLSGTNLIVHATNGPMGGTCTLLQSTNLALPLGQWAPVATVMLGGSGGFTITATNVVSADALCRFYILQAQ